MQFRLNDSWKWLTAFLDSTEWSSSRNGRLGLGSDAVLTLCSVHKLTGHHRRDDGGDEVLEVPPQTVGQGRQLILVQIHGCWLCGKEGGENREREKERERDEMCLKRLRNDSLHTKALDSLIDSPLISRDTGPAPQHTTAKHTKAVTLGVGLAVNNFRPQLIVA